MVRGFLLLAVCVHQNYLGYDGDKNPFFLSIVVSDSLCRCMLWRKTGNKRMCIHLNPNTKYTPKSVLEKFSVARGERSLKEMLSPNLQKELLTLEEQEGAVNFKFGVLYALAHQHSDDEMFCNETGSANFTKFLELLGDKIPLEGWQHFKGGLDVKRNSTGTHSVYTVFEGHEIMFHVSTLLPYSKDDQQQLERKRHIGNDIVVIIFIDGEENEAYQAALNFDPLCMRSHFNHIFALVTRGGGPTGAENYRVVVHSAESVPAFGPPVLSHMCNTTFREFLLAKLINGEKAAYCTPTFAEKKERTLDLLIKGVEQKCNSEFRRVVSTTGLHQQVFPNSSSRKKMEREQSFTDFGQRLKVEKIITGLHPTSQRTTVAPKKEPWETICVSEDFPYKITCGDACEEGTLVVSTQADGTYFLFRDGSYSLIIDKSIPIAQLVVAHRHQVIIFRTALSKDNYFYSIPLEHIFSGKLKTPAVKSSLSKYSISYTKGCHLFCTSPLDSQFLRVAVAVKNKVFMLAWKHAATLTVDGSPVTPTYPSNPADNFIKHRELHLQDTPAFITLLDEVPTGKVCVSYQKQPVVDAIDEIKRETQRIPNLDIIKGKLTCLTSIHANGRSEILIGYDMTCHLITLHDGTAYNSVELVWNSEPKDIVYMFPYILAFTSNTVEIRMASNGSLMQTINVPDLHLFSKKEDLYFTSSMLLPGCRLDNKVVKTADGGGKSLSSEKRNFSSTSKLSQQQQQQQQQQQPEGVYIYKIVAEYMTGSQRPSSAQSMNEGGVGVGVGGGGRSSRGSEEDDLAASDPECSSSSNSNSTAAVMQMSAVPSPAAARQPSPSPSPSPLACRRQLSPSILVSSEEVKLGSPLSHKNNRKIPPPPPPKPKPSSNSSHSYSSSSNAKQQKMFVLEDVDYVEDSEDSVGESASLDRLGLGGSQCSSPDSGVQEVDSSSTVLKTPPTISRMKVLNSSSPDYPKSLF